MRLPSSGQNIEPTKNKVKKINESFHAIELIQLLDNTSRALDHAHTTKTDSYFPSDTCILAKGVLYFSQNPNIDK